MALPPPPQRGSFLGGLYSSFPQQDVVVIHNKGSADERRDTVRAMIQPSTGYFDIDAPVFEGDFVEVADPRAGSKGTRELYVATVKINDMAGFGGADNMSEVGNGAHSGCANTTRSLRYLQRPRHYQQWCPCTDSVGRL